MANSIKEMAIKWLTTHTFLKLSCFVFVFCSGYHKAFVDEILMDSMRHFLRF